MKSLYDHYPKLFDGFYLKFPNVVNVAKQVTTIADMDEAIGASRGSTLHWIKGNNIPGTASERCAGVYLRNKAQGPSASATAAAVSNPEASMFLISVPEGSKAKATMLLSMLRNINCEVVDF